MLYVSTIPALSLIAVTATLRFSDRGVSAAKAGRPGLAKALDHIRKKDTLVMWKLDRLDRFPV